MYWELVKRCAHCKYIFCVDDFNFGQKTPDGLSSYCAECNKAMKVKPEIERKNNKKYRQSEKGVILRSYSSMERRVMGLNKKSELLYKDLPIMSRASFLSKSLGDKNFKILYKKWKDGGFKLKDRPTPDRIYSQHGYMWDNIRWITFSENSILGNLSNRRRYEKT